MEKGIHMEDINSRRTQALEACEKVINGIEDGTITTSSALLQCIKIARLVNDFEAQEWLGYEYGGYARNDDGHLTSEAWDCAAKHGRSYIGNEDKKRYVFTDLSAELEASIDSSQNAINNYTTEGFSVAGEWALVATERMTLRVAQNTNQLIQTSKNNERRLAILKSQYYDYAVRWKIDLQFSNTTQNVFEEYQAQVDVFFTKLSNSTLQKLSAIEALMEDGNPERYSQVLTSCRRLWDNTAKELFKKTLPDFKGKYFRTKSGVEIDISGDHCNNQLSAVIESIQTKATKNTLVGSEIIYLVDWIEQINNLQNSGVHADITREQAMQCIIHTYIALGDITRLIDSVETP